MHQSGSLPKLLKSKITRCIAWLPAAVIILAVSAPVQSTAQGNLLVTPVRLVFDGNKKSQEINLANTGKDTARYLISMMEIKMKEDGSFVTVTVPDSGQKFATPYLRFFPRSVTLAPNEAQVVKVQLMKTGTMEPGEYRSHIYFRAVPVEKPLGELTAKKDSSISVSLVPLFGISIPAIVRIGESSTKTSFNDVSLELMENDPFLHMAFTRTGNMSVYGDLTVDYVSDGGQVTRVGIAKGLAVYTPNTVRKFRLPLNKNAAVNYHAGKLRIAYTDNSGKALALAQQEIVLH